MLPLVVHRRPDLAVGVVVVFQSRKHGPLRFVLGLACEGTGREEGEPSAHRRGQVSRATTLAGILKAEFRSSTGGSYR